MRCCNVRICCLILLTLCLLGAVVSLLDDHIHKSIGIIGIILFGLANYAIATVISEFSFFKFFFLFRLHIFIDKTFQWFCRKVRNCFCHRSFGWLSFHLSFYWMCIWMDRMIQLQNIWPKSKRSILLLFML